MQKQRLIASLLIVFTLAVFSPIRNHEFVWDDRSNVTENPYLREVTGSSVVSFWQGPYQQLYIPLTYTVWAGVAALAEGAVAGRSRGLDAGPFHTVNLILHLLSVLVVFVILRLLIGNDWAAGGGALLFGLHPLQVEAVSWVTGMKDLLSGLLSLVALWQYLVYAAGAGGRRKGLGFHYGVATGAFVLALLAKPSAVAVPVVAWVLDYGILKRRVRQSGVSLGGWVVLALVFVGITKWAQPAPQLENISPLWARPLVAADALAFYLYKLFLPFGLSVDYGRSPAVVLEQGWVYLTWIVPVGLGTLLWVWRRRAAHLKTGAAVFAAGLLPILGLIPFGFQQISTVADRYVYLSMLGPALALAWAISDHRSRVLPIVCGAMLALLAVGSAIQLSAWKNNEILFQRTLRQNPDSWMSQLNLGVGLAKLGRLEEAIDRYRLALSIKPGYVHALNNLGAALFLEGRFEEAIEQYRQALGYEPEAADIHFNLAAALAKLNRLDEAIAQFRKALEIDPEAADAHYRLAQILDLRGEFDGAMNHYLEAVRGNPANAGAYLNIGVILANRGQLDAAIEYFRRALGVRPQFPEAHQSLARALALQGKSDEANRHYQEALRSLNSGP
jgi:tetratricopeptide (TPR) repeat protein